MKMRLMGSIVAILALTASSIAHLPAAVESTSACVSGPLEKAIPISDDLSPNGSPVTETTLADGTSIPVVMVHGWTGRSTHNDERTGSFSSLIDLTANKVGAASVGRSLIGQMQDVGGTSVYTFDYHDASARWVTDGAIGPELASAISCLAAKFGHPVVLMAHSMGGLAIRQALSLIRKSEASVPLSEYVDTVVTFGTPNAGSWVASVVDGGLTAAGVGQFIPGATGAAIAAVRSILVLCGTRTTSSLEKSGACGMLGDQISSSRSEAGRALRIGSSELQDLAAWPADVTVDALAGSIDLEIARTQWFGLTTRSAGNVNAGDFVVGHGSATHGGTQSRSIDCFYTLDVRAAAEDNVAADWLKLKAANDTRDNAYTNLRGSACFHGNLMRSIELSNDALGILADVVDRANIDAAIPAEMRGVWCPPSGQASASVTTPDGCFSFAALGTEYPEMSIESYQSDTRLPGVLGAHVCLVIDLGDSCSMAASMFLEYFPVGAPWNCEEWAMDNGWPGCESSYSAAHDPSQPRLRIILNHQQGEFYVDTEPMYRQ